MSSKTTTTTSRGALVVTEVPRGALTTKQAAEYVGLAAGTLENKRLAGEGPRWGRHGRKGGIYYRVVDLDAYLAANLVCA